MTPKKHLIDYTYRRLELGLTLKNLKEVVDYFKDIDLDQLSLITIQPGGKGGNHIHPRSEFFICPTNNLVLVWRDASGVTHNEKLTFEEEGKILCFEIPPYLPHAVINHSAEVAVLVELADSPQHEVETVEVIN